MFLDKIKNCLKGNDCEIVEAVKAGGSLLDVRSPGEFSMGSVIGSINIPHTEISSQKKLIAKLKEPIIVYCASGVRSTIATQELKALGYEDVVNAKKVARVAKLIAKM